MRRMFLSALMVITAITLTAPTAHAGRRLHIKHGKTACSLMVPCCEVMCDPPPPLVIETCYVTLEQKTMTKEFLLQNAKETKVKGPKTVDVYEKTDLEFNQCPRVVTRYKTVPREISVPVKLTRMVPCVDFCEATGCVKTTYKLECVERMENRIVYDLVPYEDLELVQTPVIKTTITSRERQRECVVLGPEKKTIRYKIWVPKVERVKIPVPCPAVCCGCCAVIGFAETTTPRAEPGPMPNPTEGK